MLFAEKVTPEPNQCIFRRCIAGLHPFGKGIFQTLMTAVMRLKKMKEVKQVIGIKGPVLESFQFAQIGGLVMHHEIVRRPIHALHQFAAFLNDGSAIAPGKNGGEEAGYFYVLLLAKQMGNAYGIGSNKRRLIVSINLLI